MQQIDFGEMISTSLNKFLERWQVLVPAAAVWSLVTGVVVAIIFAVLVGGGIASGGFLGALVGVVLSVALTLLVAVTLGVVQTGGLLWGNAEFEGGNTPDIASVVTANGQVSALVSTGIVFGGIALVAALLLIIPILGWLALIALAVWFGTRWAFASSVTVFEGRTGMDALRRSREMVEASGQFWVIFGIIFVVGLIGGVVAAVISAVLGIITTHLPGGGIITMVVRVVANAGTSALVSIVIYDLYRLLTAGEGSGGSAMTPPPVAPPTTPQG